MNIIDLRIYERYFRLIVSGKKTVEVRAGYSAIRQVAVGDVLRFRCKNRTCDMRVLRVAEYPSIAALMNVEDPVKTNHNRTREQQIADLHSIYPPDKEKLGMFAFEVEPVMT